MVEVSISITKTDIFHICEGISVSISQHNGGTPTFEQLWASEGESKKLDIYYREAISDLERQVAKWLKEDSTSKFNLKNDAATTYSIKFDMPLDWPLKMKGILGNKIQDYLVHAVTAGWLNDFDGVTIKQDYAQMALQDISDILYVLMMRVLNVTGESVTADDKNKESATESSADARRTDGTTKSEGDFPTAGARNTDAETKEEAIAPTADQRHIDTDIPTLLPEPGAYSRRKDDVRKDDNSPIPYLEPPMLRHKDNATVHIRKDYTDMSGTDFGRLPKNIRKPFRKRRDIDAPPRQKPFPCDNHRPPVDECCHEHPHHPADHMQGVKPPVFPTGNGWSDEWREDVKREERFINGHDCGNNGCNAHGEDPLDWNFNNLSDDEELDDATFDNN